MVRNVWLELRGSGFILLTESQVVQKILNCQPSKCSCSYQYSQCFDSVWGTTRFMIWLIYKKTIIKRRGYKFFEFACLLLGTQLMEVVIY